MDKPMYVETMLAPVLQLQVQEADYYNDGACVIITILTPVAEPDATYIKLDAANLDSLIEALDCLRREMPEEKASE